MPPGCWETASDCKKKKTKSECGSPNNTYKLQTYKLSVTTAVPCDLKDPQQANAAEHRDTERRHDLQLHQNSFSDSSAHHKAVEAVKQWHEVGL